MSKVNFRLKEVGCLTEKPLSVNTLLSARSKHRLCDELPKTVGPRVSWSVFWVERARHTDMLHRPIMERITETHARCIDGTEDVHTG